jgi:hypothetical protein
MKPENKSANQIIKTKRFDHSSWHFLQAKSWLDLAKREQLPTILHYAAIEFRYGVEYLLFELLILTKDNLTELEYQKCLRKPDKMKKLLKNAEAPYNKLSIFSKIILKLTPDVPKFMFWDLNILFKYWGVASEFLHFVGSQRDTYDSPEWLIKSIARLEKPLEEIWQSVTQTAGIGLLKPSTLSPVAQGIWDDFLTGKITEESVEFRLQTVQPISKMQRKRL